MLRLAKLRKHLWSFSLTIGLIFALILTLIIVVWELIENPGEIYFNNNGINWKFIYDLTISWFVPTFIYATVIVAIAQIIFSGIKRLKKKSS